MNEVGLILLLVVVIAFLAAQAAIFIWIAGKVKAQSEPLHPDVVQMMCVGISLICFLGGIGTTIYSVTLLMRGVRTTGTIVELRSELDKEKNVEMFRPVYSFTDTQGVTNHGSSKQSSTVPDFRVGDTVRLIYFESDPKSARINSNAENWALTIAFSLLGAIAFAVSPIYSKWYAFRARRNTPMEKSAKPQ